MARRDDDGARSSRPPAGLRRRARTGLREARGAHVRRSTRRCR